MIGSDGDSIEGNGANVQNERLGWAAQVIRMDTIRIVKKLTEWEPCSSRPVGRPRLRWLEQVEEDLKR